MLQYNLPEQHFWGNTDEVLDFQLQQGKIFILIIQRILTSPCRVFLILH